MLKWGVLKKLTMTLMRFLVHPTWVREWKESEYISTIVSKSCKSYDINVIS